MFNHTDPDFNDYDEHAEVIAVRKEHDDEDDQQAVLTLTMDDDDVSEEKQDISLDLSDPLLANFNAVKDKLDIFTANPVIDIVVFYYTPLTLIFWGGHNQTPYFKFPHMDLKDNSIKVPAVFVAKALDILKVTKSSLFAFSFVY